MADKKHQVDLGVEGEGMDNYGNTYKNAHEMWIKELEAKNLEAKDSDQNTIGSLDAWYKKAVQYWEVDLPDYRLCQPRSMACWAALAIRMTSILRTPTGYLIGLSKIMM